MEWTVEYVDSKAAAAIAKVANGNINAGYEPIKYVTFAEGAGDLGDFRKVVSNNLLGLAEEDLRSRCEKGGGRDQEVNWSRVRVES